MSSVATTPTAMVEAARASSARIAKAKNFGTAGALIAGKFLQVADQLLDRGDNDPRDPIIRLSDFPRTGEVGEGPGTLKGYIVGFVAGVPVAHPVHSIPAVGSRQDAHIIFGPKKTTWTRLSEVAKLTASHRRRPPQADAADEEQARQERIEQLDRELSRVRAAQ